MSADVFECFWIERMFHGLDPRMQRFRCIIPEHGHRALRYDVAMVDLFIDKVNRDSGNFLASDEGLLPCFESGKFW